MKRPRRPDGLSGWVKGRTGELGLQLVAGRRADPVACLGIDDLPVAHPVEIDVALRRALGRQRASPRRRRRCRRGCPAPAAAAMRVAFDDGVVRPVHFHVEPRAEDVLVDVADDAGRDLGAVLARLAGMAGGGVDDAGRLHLVFDAAVLVQVPVGGVFVVADGRDRRDHQLAGAAHLGALACARRNASTTGRHLPRAGRSQFSMVRALAEQVGHDGVEIVDRAEAVAAERQRVRHAAEADLAAVEHVLAVVAALRRAVGHHHLGDRGAVDDRPAPAVDACSRSCSAPAPRGR